MRTGSQWLRLVLAFVLVALSWLGSPAAARAWAGPPPAGATPPQPSPSTSPLEEVRNPPPDDVTGEGPEGPSTEAPPEGDAAGPADAEAEAGAEDPSETPPPPPPAVRPLLPGVAGACGLDDMADPLVPVAQALESLKPAGYRVGDCRIEADALRGRALHVSLAGQAHDLMFYLLDQVAIDGFAIELAPSGTHRFELTARPSPQRRGLRFVRVREVRLRGEGLDKKTRQQVRRIAQLDTLNFVPLLVRSRLKEIGFRTEFVPAEPGVIELRLSAARSIRRVRIYGNRGLPEREILRSLSENARPGALSRGRCVSPKQLRRADGGQSLVGGEVNPKGRPPICDPGDFACRQWEDDEIARLERYLFSAGHLRGTANLSLACGSSPEEVDLHVYIDIGRPYRVDRKAVTIEGAPREEDEAWIRRRFIPRTFFFFRTPLTRAAMDRARDDVTRYYAQPGRAGARLWRGADIAYPEVEVSSTYDQLTRQTVPLERDLPLTVYIDTGLGIQARFVRVDRARLSERLDAQGGALSLSPARRRRPSFTNAQLTSQLQIFTRRDAPNRSTASREAANIRAFYQRKGYLFADVSGDLVTSEGSPHAELRFEIYEGPRVRIADLDVVRPQGPSDEEYDEIKRALRDEAKLRKRGAFSEREALEDVQTLLAAYNAAGYLCAAARVELAFWPDAFDRPGAHAVLGVRELVDARNRPSWTDQLNPAGLNALLSGDGAKLYVRIVVDPGPQVTTSRNETLRFLESRLPRNRRVEGAPTTATQNWGAVRILRDTPLRRDGSTSPGQIPLNLDLEEDTREAIVSRYRNDGFPLADAELSWVWTRADGTQVPVEDIRSLAEPGLGLCREATDARSVAVDAVVNVYEGKRGRHGDVLLRGNFRTQDRVLRQQIEIETGAPYSERDLKRSLDHIEAVGVARTVRLTPYPVGCDIEDERDCVVHQVLTMEEARDVAVDVPFGIGGATLNPVYVFAKPSFPNIGGSAWNFELDGRLGLFGFDALPNPSFCDGLDCYEHNLRGSLLRPRIGGSPIDFELTGRYQQRVTPARGRIESAYGALRFTWRVTEELSIYAGYLFQLANISDDLVKPLGGGLGRWVNRGAAIVADRAGLFESGIVMSRVDNPFNPGEGFIAAADLKLASPLLGGLDWFARVDLRFQQFIPIPRTQERLDFRYSLAYGHAIPFSGPFADTKTIPDIWRYYGGGTAALGLRGIAPETMLVDVEEIELPYGGTIFRPRAQGGQIRAIGTLAFQVVSAKNFLGGALAHSVFYDFGVLTQFWQQVQFPRDYRHSAGINALKWDIKLVTLALGYAWLLPTRGNIGPTDDPNGRIVFDVGITF